VFVQDKYVKEVKQIMDSHKTGFMNVFYPMFVQIPVATGYYFALTMMCSHHLPSMVVDSAPFGFDLTIADPFHLAPFACSGTIMMAVRNSHRPNWDQYQT
jgi:membrane protein insertase Oxa1/YidC/SpoIIIJ